MTPAESDRLWQIENVERAFNDAIRMAQVYRVQIVATQDATVGDAIINDLTQNVDFEFKDNK